MGTYVSSSPAKIYSEDIQTGSSVSESIGAKIGSVINFIIDEFVHYPFGVSGSSYSGLSSYPYTFSGSLESLKYNCVIEKITVFNEVSGISGTSEFYIERQLAAGGAWTNIFSTNCSILNTAADNLYFETGVAAPTGVTLPILSITSFSKSDKLRLVLVQAADQAQNLKIKLITRPVI